MTRLSEECDDAFERERRRGSCASGGYGVSHRATPSQSFRATDEYVRVLNIESETNKAWLLHLSSGSRDWFPKSVCRVAPNGSGMLYLRCPGWLWKQKKVPGALASAKGYVNGNR